MSALGFSLLAMTVSTAASAATVWVALALARAMFRTRRLLLAMLRATAMTFVVPVSSPQRGRVALRATEEDIQEKADLLAKIL